MDPGEAERAERVLASARSILAVAALIAIYIDPTEPTRYYLSAYSLLLAYVLYSFGVVIALPLVQKPLRLQVPLHAADLIWITVLTAFTQGPNQYSVFRFLHICTGSGRLPLGVPRDFGDRNHPQCSFCVPGSTSCERSQRR